MLLLKTLLQISSKGLSRLIIFVRREVVSKIAIWMDSLNEWVCCNALSETEFFTLNSLRVRRLRMETRNFSRLYEWVLRKNYEYWSERRILFRNVWKPIHDDQIILIPRSKVKCIGDENLTCWLMIRNFLAVLLIASSSFIINWCLWRRLNFFGIL